MAALHFICGKAGAGKTTLAHRLGATLPAIVFVEDEWISTLGFEITSLTDFIAASQRCGALIASMAVDLLKMEVSVVFDFAGNTRKDRQWVRDIFEVVYADRVLHVIEATDEQCLANIHRRNEEKLPGIYAGYVSDETFHQVTRHFLPPQGDEGVPAGTALKQAAAGSMESRSSSSPDTPHRRTVCCRAPMSSR